MRGFLCIDLLAQASTTARAGPDIKADSDLKVRTASNRAAARIAGKFEKQPLVEASIRQTISTTYSDLGLYSDAQRQMERPFELRRRVLGEGHPDTLGTLDSVAELYRLQGKYPSLATLQEGPGTPAPCAGRRAPRHAVHDERFCIVVSLSREIRAVRGGLCRSFAGGRRRVLGEQHLDTLSSMSDLAVLYRHQRKYADAGCCLRRLWLGGSACKVPSIRIR
jgi:hypothetical protein